MAEQRNAVTAPDMHISVKINKNPRYMAKHIDDYTINRL